MPDVIQQKYVILNRGVPTKIVIMNQGNTLDLSGQPDKEMALYDPEVHSPIQKKPVAPDYVAKDVFLFDLLSISEQLALQYHVNNIQTLGEWDQVTPSMTGGLYRSLELASRQVENIDRVQLSSNRTSQFLTLCGYLGIFGADPAVQTQRIADILNAKMPDGTYINEE